ncbi:succinylglutamate desuccinylase/aspartoacylase family protein [Sphingobacterium sp. MYb388]|uniref:succinylglutamate desuccinylase/aspartoacylase family protein n=1 Tax=Sphingobacterium sp. MYb388 TaxID=2745437 RepID=UPI0030B287E5
MKHFSFLIFILITFQSLKAQKLSIRRILDQEKSVITDTTFQLTTRDKRTVPIPITLVSGSEKGPTFTIIAGIHGMEYPTILSLLQLRKEIDPKKLKGNLIIIPIANVPSFYSRTPFVNPMDEKNLNRVFPGHPNGSITEVMADFLTREVFSATDVLLDMHGGDVGEDLIPFICYYNNEEFKAQTKKAAHLSEISGFDTIVSYPYILNAHQPAMYAFKQAVSQGITALSIEIGKLGYWNKDEVSKTNDAIYRMLFALKMYDKKDISPTSFKKIRYTKQAYISVPVQGIFYSNIKAGDHVQRDDEIGFITDLFGNKISTILAPATGVILYKIGTPPVNIGETLCCIGIDDNFSE